jgi:hypothetical protein
MAKTCFKFPNASSTFEILSGFVSIAKNPSCQAYFFFVPLTALLKTPQIWPRNTLLCSGLFS